MSQSLCPSFMYSLLSQTADVHVGVLHSLHCFTAPMLIHLHLHHLLFPLLRAGGRSCSSDMLNAFSRDSVELSVRFSQEFVEATCVTPFLCKRFVNNLSHPLKKSLSFTCHSLPGNELIIQSCVALYFVFVCHAQGTHRNVKAHLSTKHQLKHNKSLRA